MASKPPFKTGMEEFENLILNPFKSKIRGHPRNADFIQARKNPKPRREGEKQDHVYVYKDKEGGIEPGCLVFEGTDAFHQQMNLLLIKKLKDARIAIANNLHQNDPLPFERALKHACHNDLQTIDRYISALENNKPQINPIFKKFFGSGIYPACEAELIASYANWRKQLPLAKQPDMLLLKGDFSNGIVVSVGAARTMGSTRMQKLKEIFGQSTTKKVFGNIYNLFKMRFKKTKNLDFTKETLVNNLAVSYGMQGQIASVKPGLYKDGTPMLMNAQTWAKGFSTFGGRLKGGTKISGSCIAKDIDPTTKAEMVKKWPALQKIAFQSDNTIKGIPQSVAFFLQTGDRDMIGGGGGNKGIVNNELYAIDFGHSLEKHGIFEDNGILADFKGKPNLRDDFRFKQPGKPIKHIDAFYDHPLSEMMQGVYLLMRQNNVPVPANVLAWYAAKAKEKTPEGQAAQYFLDKFNNIEPGCAIKLFDTYIEKFREAAKHLPAYKGYAASIEALKKKYVERTTHFLNVFNKRIALTPDELTLIENVEKLLCNPKHITNTSPDGTVLLNHLRVDFDHRIPCQLQKVPDGIQLHIDIKDNKSYQQFEAIFRKFNEELYKKMGFNYEPQTKKMIVTCPEQHIESLMKAFQEANIARYYNKPTGTSLQAMLTVDKPQQQQQQQQPQPQPQQQETPGTLQISKLEQLRLQFAEKQRVQEAAQNPAAMQAAPQKPDNAEETEANKLVLRTYENFGVSRNKKQTGTSPEKAPHRDSEIIKPR